MSNDVNVLDKNPVSTPVSSSVISPQGSLNKEAPIATGGLSEIKPVGSEVKHNLDQEMVEAEVREISSKPDLTSEHQELGIKHAGPDITVISEPAKSPVLPMSNEEIEKLFKTGQDDDSEKWYLALWKKIIAWGSKPR